MSNISAIFLELNASDNDVLSLLSKISNSEVLLFELAHEGSFIAILSTIAVFVNDCFSKSFLVYDCLQFWLPSSFAISFFQDLEKLWSILASSIFLNTSLTLSFYVLLKLRSSGFCYSFGLKVTYSSRDNSLFKGLEVFDDFSI